MIQDEIDDTRWFCRKCGTFAWRRIKPRWKRTPLWLARLAWRLSLRRDWTSRAAGAILSRLLWHRVCQSCMIEQPTRLLLDNQYLGPWRGEPGRVRNAYVRPPPARQELAEPGIDKKDDVKHYRSYV
jgi:hypothetical protein